MKISGIDFFEAADCDCDRSVGRMKCCSDKTTYVKIKAEHQVSKRLTGKMFFPVIELFPAMVAAFEHARSFSVFRATPDNKPPPWPGPDVFTLYTILRI